MPRTSGRRLSLLAFRGGLTGAFELAPVNSGAGPFVSSTLVNEDSDCIFLKPASLRIDSWLFWRLMVRCVSGDGGRGFMARATSRVTIGTSAAEDTMASVYACVRSS
jgi:hypothetical protein